jgi:hypothetical protein
VPLLTHLGLVLVHRTLTVFQIDTVQSVAGCLHQLDIRIAGMTLVRELLQLFVLKLDGISGTLPTTHCVAKRQRLQTTAIELDSGENPVPD